MIQLELDFGPEPAAVAPAKVPVSCSPREDLQLELNLFGPREDEAAVVSPLEEWKNRRAMARRALNGQIGLPLGRKVEVVLHDGLMLRGLLELVEGEALWIEQRTRSEAIALPLTINQANFTARDVASCRIIE